MDHTTMNQAIADFAMLTHENQQTFAWHTGPNPWAADVDTATLRLDRDYRIALLGSHSEESQTWWWSWANTQYAGDTRPVIALAAALRERADQLHMPELTATEPFPVDGLNDLGWLPASGLASVAGHLLGAPALFSGSYPGGRIWLAVLDAPAPVADPVKFMRWFDMGAESARAFEPQTGIRHRQMVELYGLRRGLQVSSTPETTTLAWPGGSRVEVRYDELGRGADITSTLHSADVRPPLPHEPQEG